MAIRCDLRLLVFHGLFFHRQRTRYSRLALNPCGASFGQWGEPHPPHFAEETYKCQAATAAAILWNVELATS